MDKEEVFTHTSVEGTEETFAIVGEFAGCKITLTKPKEMSMTIFEECLELFKESIREPYYFADKFKDG